MQRNFPIHIHHAYGAFLVNQALFQFDHLFLSSVQQRFSNSSSSFRAYRRVENSLELLPYVGGTPGHKDNFVREAVCKAKPSSRRLVEAAGLRFVR